MVSLASLYSSPSLELGKAEPLDDPWGRLELISESKEAEREGWEAEGTNSASNDDDELMDDWDWLLGPMEPSSELENGRDGEWDDEEGEEGKERMGEGEENDIEQRCLKVGTVNVRDGSWKEPERLEALIEYLGECDLDALALQELNRWDERLLQERALRWGHNHTQFLHTNSGYHLGFTSSLPFTLIRARTEGFHHGMLHVEFERGSGAIPRKYLINNTPSGGDPYRFDDVNDEDEEDDIYDVEEDIYESALHMIVTHLDPHDAEMRLSEAHHIDRQGREHPLLLVFGDLNALSPRDREFYDRDHLLTALLSTPELKRKFVYTDYDGEEAIDYRVMEKFFVGGRLVDVTASDEREEGHLERTVPTAINEDPYHVAPMRLDYILSTDEFAQFLSYAHVDNTNRTQHLSDHLPVLAEFCF